MRKRKTEISLPPDYIIQRVLEIHRSMRRKIKQDPELAFKPYWFKTNGKSKHLVAVDLLAERAFIDDLTRKFGSENIRVIGEECLSESIDLTNETRTTVLIDMIDGTDLLQRGFSNWCSAITVFQPSEKKIKEAFVALPSENLYYATVSKFGAYKKRLSWSKKNKEIPLRRLSCNRALKDASVCMYVQKSSNLLKLLSLGLHKPFMTWLEKITKIEQKHRNKSSSDTVGFRFYNLAGNPMMVKVAEGVVDLVIELNGQAPHDVVPGAFIATKAGAVLGTVTGDELPLTEIAEALLQPSDSRLKYILAANKSLLKDISDLLCSNAK